MGCGDPSAVPGEDSMGMCISHRQRFVFIAYPRTGSTSITRILDPLVDVRGRHISEVSEETPFYDHITAREVKNIFEKRGWHWDRYRRFAVVRNPFERIVSLYLHRRQLARRWRRENRLVGNLNGLLIRILPEKPGFSYYVLTRRSDTGLSADFRTYTCDENGGSLLSDVLRFEHLTESLPGYLAQIGLTLPEGELPHLYGVSYDRDYREYYTAAIRRRVAMLYQYDIERFSYTF